MNEEDQVNLEINYDMIGKWHLESELFTDIDCLGPSAADTTNSPDFMELKEDGELLLLWELENSCGVDTECSGESGYHYFCNQRTNHCEMTANREWGYVSETNNYCIQDNIELDCSYIVMFNSDGTFNL